MTINNSISKLPNSRLISQKVARKYVRRSSKHEKIVEEGRFGGEGSPILLITALYEAVARQLYLQGQNQFFAPLPQSSYPLPSPGEQMVNVKVWVAEHCSRCKLGFNLYSQRKGLSA